MSTDDRRRPLARGRRSGWWWAQVAIVAGMGVCAPAAPYGWATEPAAAQDADAKTATRRVTPPPAELKLDPFYEKYVDADGFPIVASGKVSDYALLEAAYLVDLMLAKRPDIKRAMVAGGSRLVVIGYRQFTTDIPEHREFQPKDYWDRRARGTGGSSTDPICSCGEENLLAFPGDPYSAECILIHEFAHSIHLRGMSVVDPTFDQRVKQAYDDAMQRGLWKQKYASVNHHEYFAEGVQSWFDNNRPPDHDHNHVRTRALLKEYDPGLAKLCEEVFGDTQLKYTKPTTRLRDHLAGFDPQQSPRFEWPERLVKQGEQIRREALARGQKESQTRTAAPVAADEYEVKTIEGWQVHIHPHLRRDEAAATDRALALLADQLRLVVRVVPAKTVDALRKVPLWFSPEYPGIGPRAEYHPDVGWLREHGRNVEMDKSIEFTNVRIFAAEIERMPVFVLHELAHAFHDRVLGFDNAEIKQAYQRAVASGTYEKVPRWNGRGKPEVHERAYAMVNEKEYFAELSEAFFGRNDFFPFDRDELQRHDPQMCELLRRVWGL